MSASKLQLARYLGELTVYLRNFGAILPEPEIDPYDSGEIGFDFEATLPGPDEPKPALIAVGEIWSPVGHESYERAEYRYELIEHPLNRRRAFHMHDTDEFRSRAGVLVHEHCEEILGHPTCAHYFGLPVGSGYDALNALLSLWGQPGPMGCSRLRCMG